MMMVAARIIPIVIHSRIRCGHATRRSHSTSVVMIVRIGHRNRMRMFNTLRFNRWFPIVIVHIDIRHVDMSLIAGISERKRKERKREKEREKKQRVNLKIERKSVIFFVLLSMKQSSADRNLFSTTEKRWKMGSLYLCSLDEKRRGKGLMGLAYVDRRKNDDRQITKLEKKRPASSNGIG